MQLSSKLYIVKAEEKRLFDRLASDFKARIGTAPSRTHDVTIRNISRGGFMIEGPARLAGGMTVAIDMPPLFARPAKVIWAYGMRAGCEFEVALEERELQTILRSNVIAAQRPGRAVFGRKPA